MVQNACALIHRSVFNRCVHNSGKRHIQCIGIFDPQTDGQAALRICIDKKKPFAPIKVIRAKGEIPVKMVIMGMVSLVSDIFRTL